MSLQDVLAEAMKLELEDRAELAHRLLHSLDEPSESEVERLWVEVAQRRAKELREGTAEAIPAEEAVREVMKRIT